MILMITMINKDRLSAGLYCLYVEETAREFIPVVFTFQ